LRSVDEVAEEIAKLVRSRLES